MTRISEMVDSILDKESGITSYNDTSKQKIEHGGLYEAIDNMDEEELSKLERKVSMRKERLKFLKEQELNSKKFPM